MVDERSAHIAGRFLAGGAIGLGGFGVLIGILNLVLGVLTDDPLSSLPIGIASVGWCGFILYWGVREWRKDPDTLLTDVNRAGFMETPCGKALVTAGFFASDESSTIATANPKKLTPAEQEILKEFFANTLSIQKGMKSSDIDESTLRESQMAIDWHARQAARRLHEDRDDRQIAASTEQQGRIIASGYMPPVE